MEAHLYAMVGKSTQGSVIRRLPLEAETHQEIVDLLAGQAGHLTAEDINLIDYDPAYQPQEGEAFVVSFCLPEQLGGILKAPGLAADLSRGELEAGHIRAIIAAEAPWGDEQSRVLFQAFTLALAIRAPRFALLLHQDTLRKVTQPGFSIGRQVDAIYSVGSLRFLNVFRVRQFLDIGPVLTPATDAQLRQFAKHKHLIAEDMDGFLAAADDLTRRRVAGLLQRRLLDRVRVKRVVSAATAFDLEVRTTKVNGKAKIVLPTDRGALKRLITFLDENVYSSPLTGVAFQAGGKRKWKV
jgi:hypothetical protein